MNKTPTLAELTEARTFIADLIVKLEADRDLVGRNLNGSILDGTPYATVILEGGAELVGGNWNDYKTGRNVDGFIDFRVVPAGLCGAYLSSLETVTRRIAALKARGTPAVAIHRRELERRQLERIENDLRTFRNTLAELDGKIASPTVLA